MIVLENLEKVENSQFGSVICDYYGNGKGEFFMTRQQIGESLEYSNPNKDIDTLHRRHKERLDKFSTTVTLRVVEGGRYVNREMCVYNAKGVYEICRWSRQPKADEFYDHVYDILEGLRLGYLKLSTERDTKTWEEQRKHGMLARKAETDVLKNLVDLAKQQGFSHEDKLLYMNYTKLANKICGVKGRDKATAEQLTNLTVAENIILHCVQDGVNQQKNYKEIYQNCKERLTTFQNVAYVGYDSK